MHLYLKSDMLSLAQISNSGTEILNNENMDLNMVPPTFHLEKKSQLIDSIIGVCTIVADDDDDDDVDGDDDISV